MTIFYLIVLEKAGLQHVVFQRAKKELIKESTPNEIYAKKTRGVLEARAGKRV